MAIKSFRELYQFISDKNGFITLHHAIERVSVFARKIFLSSNTIREKKKSFTEKLYRFPEKQMYTRGIN
jgi:hypothetical protein